MVKLCRTFRLHNLSSCKNEKVCLWLLRQQEHTESSFPILLEGKKKSVSKSFFTLIFKLGRQHV